jgi:hypothetical protein
MAGLALVLLHQLVALGRVGRGGGSEREEQGDERDCTDLHGASWGPPESSGRGAKRAIPSKSECRCAAIGAMPARSRRDLSARIVVPLFIDEADLGRYHANVQHESATPSNSRAAKID